jgi:hypothetical protein
MVNELQSRVCGELMFFSMSIFVEIGLRGNVKYSDRRKWKCSSFSFVSSYSLMPPFAPTATLKFTQLYSSSRPLSGFIMAPYATNNPRRSSRIENLPAVSYSDTRKYTRSAVVKKAPVKKAATKEAPVKKAPAKKAPAKKAPVKKSPLKKVKEESLSSSINDFLDDEDEIQDAPAKKGHAKKVKQESSSSSSSNHFIDDEDSGDDVAPIHQPRKVLLRHPQPTV